MAVLHPGDVVAIRYGELGTRHAEQFHRYDTYGRPDSPMMMDYFFWAVQTEESTILVDCGYHPDAIKDRPGRVCTTPPVEGLAALGVDPDQVSHVVVTHGHFDHTGNLPAFPEARFTVHRRELAFWTGPYGREPAAAASVEASEIEFIERAHAQGRVDLIDSDAEIAPGVRALFVPGHCPGQLMVEVSGASKVLVCSDALHFYEELDLNMPYHVFFDLEQTYAAYARFRDYSTEGFTVVAGHDPEVMSRFRPVAGADGLAVHLTSS